VNRRRAWAIGGVGAALVVVVAASWLWLSSGDVSPAAGPPATSSAPTPEIDVRTTAQQALDDHLEECTSAEVSDDAVPDGCGIRIPWGTEFAAVDDVRFRIEQLPVLELTDGGFVADGGVLVATVSGTGQDGSPRTETYRTDSWTLRGGVTVEGDTVELDVW